MQAAVRVSGKSAAPGVGTIGCCVHCSGLIKFGEAGSLLRVSQEDLDAMPPAHKRFCELLSARALATIEALKKEDAQK